MVDNQLLGEKRNYLGNVMFKLFHCLIALLSYCFQTLRWQWNNSAM